MAIKIFKINIYIYDKIVREGYREYWKFLLGVFSSRDHLARGEKRTSSRIGHLFLSVGFLMYKSRSHSSSTFVEAVSKRAQLWYDLL